MVYTLAWLQENLVLESCGREQVVHIENVVEPLRNSQETLSTEI